MKTFSRIVPHEIRRMMSWFIGTGIIVVVPLAYAIDETRRQLPVTVLTVMVGGALLGLYMHVSDSRVANRVRGLPAPVILAVLYPIALWGTATVDYIGAFDPEPTPQMVWHVGTLFVVWITVIGASLADGTNWFRGFGIMFWVCFVLTILIYGVGIIFLPMALAYGSAARQCAKRRSAVNAETTAEAAVT